MADRPTDSAEQAALTFSQRIVFIGIYCFFAFLALLPLSWARGIGAGLGYFYYKLANKRVHIVRVNLQLCYPDLNNQDREQLVKASFIAAGQWVFEAGAIWLWPTKKILRYVTVANIDIFTKALANGHGVVLAMPHIGNWEVMGPFTTRHSEFACFYQHDSEGTALNEFVRQRRMRNGTVMAPANIIGIRRLYKHLRANKVAGLLPDHFPTDNMGVFAPFFGRPVLTGTLISELARKNNAPVIATAVIRTAVGFTIHFIEVPNQDSDDAVVAATALNRVIEQCIALAPEQFQWVYPRFKRLANPELETNPYRQIDK